MDFNGCKYLDDVGGVSFEGCSPEDTAWANSAIQDSFFNNKLNFLELAKLTASLKYFENRKELF